MKKNDIIRLEITALANSGDGIGRHEGIAVFVPGTAVGDLCEVIIIKMLSNRAIGKLARIITPSPDRVENLCPAFPACGGCQYRHLSYGAELKWKLASVCDAMTRIGGVEIPADTEIHGAENTVGYRNKAMYPLVSTPSGTAYGFYRSGTHSVIPCKRDGEFVPCAIQPQKFDLAARTVVKWMDREGIPAYDEVTGSGAVRGIYLRSAEATGELMVCLITAKNKLPNTSGLTEDLKAADIGFSTLVLNHNSDRSNTLLGKNSTVLYGKGNVTDRLCGVQLSISPLSFYQVNRTQCEKLYGIAMDFAGSAVDLKNASLLDLYCGVGSIALAFAPKCKAVFGIEIIPDAILNARENARLNGIENASFECGDSATAPGILSANGFSPDIITVDPPRKGISPDVADFLKNSGVRHVVYISCEPTTLARDARLLSDTFRVEKLAAVDMFPRTANTEAVCLFSRIDVHHRV